MIIQSTWRSEIGWNDVIPESLSKPWSAWLEGVKKIESFELPRRFSSDIICESVELHVFVDASAEGYGAVSYLRFVQNSKISVSFVMSKARVAPLKCVSIPRLELQAALVGARMKRFIIEEIGITITRSWMWSDSQTVIAWLKSDSRKFQQYVGHRVGEILELTDASDWHWISTKENVADEMTRLASNVDWSPESRWLNGPAFLHGDFEQQSNGEIEIAKFCLKLENYEGCVIDVSRFSSLRRLLRVAAFVMRAIKRMQKGQVSAFLKPDEMQRAEVMLVRHVQRDAYPVEYKLLLENQPLRAKSFLHKLNVYLDEEKVIRVHGRLDNSKLDHNTKRPIVLPLKSKFTDLLLMNYHVKLGHHGYEKIINEVRQKYFIPGLRSAVRSLPRKCQECKINSSKPTVPPMGQLPISRVEGPVYPFTNCGVDYFGPIEVIVKRSREKRYGVLFTCLSVRAVHLEIAHSLTTDSCLQAIRRFVSRRGCPKTLWSDNGTNFIGASAELKECLRELNQERLSDGCLEKGIEWKFIPPSAPHFGGSWERMVRSVKIAMSKTLSSRTINDEVLQTVFCEAEHTVNSHPLTHVSDNPADDEALTPNHFLIGRSSNVQSPGIFDETDVLRRKHWRAAQFLADDFWRRWTKEYLPTLLRREKWCEAGRDVKEGDVVLEVNPNLPRNTWKKGRVVKLFPGQDGFVRVVDIQLSNGHVFRRPVARLCILDVDAGHGSQS